MTRTLTLFALTTTLVACDTQNFESLDADFDAVARGNQASVRLIHLSPDAPDVDITTTGGSGGEYGLTYETASRTRSVSPGMYQVNIWEAGTQNLALQADVNFDAGSKTTIIAFDEVASLQPAVLTADTRGIPSGYNRLQVFHSAVGAGTVDVWELQTGAKLVDDFAFGSTGELDVAQGPLEIGLDLMPNDGVPDFTFSVPDVGADQFLNIFPVIDATGVALLAVFPDNSIVRIPAN